MIAMYPIDQVREYVDRARKQEADARQQLNEAEYATAFWSKLLDLLSTGHHGQILLALRGGEEYTRRLRESGELACQIIEEVQSEAEKHAKKEASTFVQNFPNALREAGLEADPASRHPLYTLKKGFVRVEIDERMFTAKVKPRDGKEIVLGIDVAPLVSTLQAEVSRIFDRKQNHEVFLTNLYRAYKAALASEERAEGDELPLRKITKRLSKNRKHFAYDEFNVDLARLLQSGRLVTSGRKLHVNHTRNTRQGMLLYGLEQGGYIGFISFKKEGVE
jgi:hypothetical protein